MSEQVPNKEVDLVMSQERAVDLKLAASQMGNYAVTVLRQPGDEYMPHANVPEGQVYVGVYGPQDKTELWDRTDALTTERTSKAA